MAYCNEYVGLDRRILQHIRGTARLLARTNSVPGMDYEDFEQDLIFDLWRRTESFDPSRASYRTFADRVVAHRVANITCPTARLAAERDSISLETVAPGSDQSAELLPDVEQRTDRDHDLQLGLQIDTRRFIAGLSPAQIRCCDILMSGNVADATAAAGLHRSSIYEAAKRLRQLAVAAGLHEYLSAPRQFGARAGM